jgi:hypothetical protein
MSLQIFFLSELNNCCSVRTPRGKPRYLRGSSQRAATHNRRPLTHRYRPDSRSTHLSRAASRYASSFCQRRPPYPPHLLGAASTPARAEKRHAGSPCQPTDANFHSQATRPARLPAQCRASPSQDSFWARRPPVAGMDGPHLRVAMDGGCPGARVLLSPTTSHRNPFPAGRHGRLLDAMDKEIARSVLFLSPVLDTRQSLIDD